MTRPLVIDADAFTAFYRESVLANPNLDATGSAQPIFSAIGPTFRVFVDAGDQILSEWANGTGDDYWVRSWLGDRLTLGEAEEISTPANLCRTLLQGLHGSGFPHSRDVWYVRTAHASRARSADGVSFILSEDMHFFDPSAKSSLHGENRIAFMLAGRGPIPRALRSEAIEVFCIGNCPCP